MAIDNLLRAQRAREALAAYTDEDEEANIIDLLTDVMHLCRGTDRDFSRLLSMAEYHAEEESAGLG